MKVNLFYIILNMIFLFITKTYLENKKINNSKIRIAIILYLIFTLITCSYFNNLMNNIFDLKMQDLKIYLATLIATNTIMLYTINKHPKIKYQIPSYLLFIITVLILVFVIPIVIGNKIKIFYIMDISNAIVLINLSCRVFIYYILIISIIYIITLKKEYFTINNIKNIIQNIKKKIQTKKELNNEGLYINGIDVSIILEDSNKENIIKNYDTLTENINARLTNGYTLNENKLLKSICTKLQIGSINGLDITNENILNQINEEEYNLLKRVFGLN